jgi:uncharacterized protein (TIGR00255 family)
MIKSMTGYGRAGSGRGGQQLTAEIRTVNHRFSEFSIRLPRELAQLEPVVKELLQKRIPRGSVTATISSAGSEAGRLATIDRAKAEHYLVQLRSLKKDLGLKGGVDLRTLIALPDVVSITAESAAPDDSWERLSEVLDDALAQLEQMRKREGTALERDLKGRLVRMDRTVARIAARAKTRPARFRRQLQERVRQLAEGLRLDPARLAQEIALFADRADITEELVRFRSHCAAFAAALKQHQPVGRRLDFLLQEMNREANTIGSKANDAAVAQLAVDLKEQIEKMREQAQNVE